MEEQIKFFYLFQKILVSTNSIQGIDKKYKNKISHIGFLLRENILGVKTINLDVSKNNLSILIIGGSQSAKVFGEQIPEVIEECIKKGIKFNVYQQCLEYQKKIFKIFMTNLKLNLNYLLLMMIYQNIIKKVMLQLQDVEHHQWLN